MSEPAKYEIRSVNDFLKVPEDRIEDCLQEFHTALEMHRAMKGLVDMVAGHDIDTTFPCFTWIDDGERNATLNMVEDNNGRQN